MNVLRVFWILKTYRGLVANRKDFGRTECRYKSEPMQTDFPANCSIEEAHRSIYLEHGQMNLTQSLKEGSYQPKFAEVVSSKIVDNSPIERPEIVSEKTFEQPLFDGVTWSQTLSKKGSK